MKRIVPYISIFIFSIIVLLFQNCGQNINLNAVTALPSTPLFASTSLKAELCPYTDTTLTYEAKTIFIVDMSLSNILLDNLLYEQCAYYGGPPFYSKYTQPSPINSTDFNGARFDILEDLIQTIGSDQSKDLSIMGFHDYAFFGPGVESCMGDFVNKAHALQEIEYLRQLQHQDTLYDGSCVTQNPYNLKATSYLSALGCLKEKIEYSAYAGASNKKSFYNVIFLTDGKPSDTNPTYEIPSKLQSLLNDLQSEMLGFKLYPIYYGELGGEEEVSAKAILDTMAHIVDPSINTLVTNDLPVIKQYLLDNLGSQTNVLYQLKNFHIFNLNSINKKGRLFVDSNMNGVPDSEDTSVDTIRSIFDSFEDNPNEDKDPLPSFIEKIKGLRVDLNDYTLDKDQDGLSNGRELLEGRDILSQEQNFPTPSQYINQQTIQYGTSNMCESGAQQIHWNIHNVQRVEGSLGFQDPNPKNGIDFSYNAGENLLMLYFVAEPTNVPGAKSKMFMSLIPVKIDAPISLKINIDNFHLIGEF